MSLTGDFDELDALIDAFDPALLKRDALMGAADRVAEVAEEQYAAGQGPDGEAWPANKNGRFPSLRRLTADIVFVATEDGIRGVGDEILRYHHDRSPRYAHLERRTFPRDGQLSEPWARAAEEGAGEAIEERLKGAG